MTKRRRLLAPAAPSRLVALLAVLLWPIGVLTGDDDDGSSRERLRHARRQRAILPAPP